METIGRVFFGARVCNPHLPVEHQPKVPSTQAIEVWYLEIRT